MSELESVLNYLETTSMEPHDDYTSEFSYKEQKVLWKYIKQLQQENKKYKEVIDKLKNIINEMINCGYIVENGESAVNYIATGGKSEFGTRAKVILDILKEVEHE